jgi:hypothetical protein
MNKRRIGKDEVRVEQNRRAVREPEVLTLFQDRADLLAV